MNLLDLASMLVRNPTKLRVVDDTITALSIIEESPLGYVWPTLTQSKAIGDSPQIILITAPGAVGKSIAAEALASELNWPLINAARAQVGSYSLTGLLHDALGFESTYINDVAAGKGGIVIDALDEAHLRAGTSNFQAFLENICKLAERPHGNSTIVVLSRPDTAVLIKLFMEESGAAYLPLTIDFFNYTQACEFLRSYLLRLSGAFPNKNYGVSRKHPDAYSKLRDMRMSEIACSLTTQQSVDFDEEWENISGFLGYAPVLSVLAEFLAVSNPHAEMSHPLSAKSDAQGILIQIIQNLLEREQLKFQGQVCARLLTQVPADEDWPQMSDCYDPSEQSIRLVAKYLDLDVVVQRPAMLPRSIRERYEKDAAQFTADHPFMAGSEAVNTVFADYILANAAVNDSCLASLRPDPRTKLREPGPFFYQFVHKFAAQSDEHEDPKISERLVEVLLSSHEKAQLDLDRSYSVIFQTELESGLVLVEKGVSKSIDTYRFSITDYSGVLVIGRKLSRTAVFSSGGVVLGQRGERFLLGPAATISCAELEIHAGSLSIDGGKERGGYDPSSITCETIHVTGNLIVDSRTPDALAIYGSASWPALRAFLKPIDARRTFAKQVGYVDLRAILRAFRQGAGSAPSVYRDLMEQRIVKANTTRQTFLARLVELGIVYEQSNHYYLRTDELAKRGINWHSMIDGEPAKSILDFIVVLTDVEH